MKKKILIISAIVIVVIILAAIIFTRGKKETIKIETSTVSYGNIKNTVTATGTVEPIDQIDVGTQVSGVINKIYVDYNDVVKKGQLLAELDRSTLKAMELQAKASLSSAENELHYREQNYNRIKKLYEGTMVSETDYEDAEYQYKNAKTNYEQLKSKLEQAEVNLSYAYIYSPINGVILNRSVEEGQTVAASFSTPTLFSIARDLTKMQVEADVDEADIGQVKLNQQVNFTVDAYPDDTFPGQVTQIRLEPTVSSNVVTYTVIIEAPNKDLKLMPGLTASVEIVTQEAKNVLMIPPKALQFEPTQELASEYTIKQFPEPGQGKPKGDLKKHKPAMEQSNGEFNRPPMGPDMKNAKLVWVKKGNEIEPRMVETGMDDEVNIEIKRGLNDGDSVIIGTSKIQISKNKTSQSGSPFMPKPPQRNNKKGK